MTKVVYLINPPTPAGKKIIRNTGCASESKGNYLLQPYDFILLSGSFPEETKIQFIDGLADNLSDQDIFGIMQSSQDSLIICAIVDRLWDHDLNFIQSLRKKFTKNTILAFGDAFIERSNCLDILQFVDGIIASPLELKADKLLQETRLEIQQNPEIFGLKNVNAAASPPNKKSVLQKINPPRHELFVNSKYRFPFAGHKAYSTVNLTWGCPYTCSYCPASHFPSYYREAADVLAEIKKIKQMGISEIYFADLSFGIPLPNTFNLLQSLINEKIDLSWSTYFHPNQYTNDFLELMKKAGCHTIILGIESFNISSLEKYGRITSKEKIENLIRKANEIKLNICADFIIGLPGETKRDILQTIKYSKSLDIDYASFNIAAPLPGSVFKKSAIADGRINESDHHFDSVGNARTLSSDQLPNTELINLRNLAVRSFYLRPGYVIKRIMRLRSVEHFLIQFEEMFQILKKAN